MKDCDLTAESQVTLLYNEPLEHDTTWRVGEPAARLNKPAHAVDEWFISATFKLPTGSKETSLQIIKELLARRASTQLTNEYNCGSVFRNTPGDFAARLIESCDLRGLSTGGAMISQKHANFIINNQGSATAADIEALIHLVQTKVREQTTIELMREVPIIGDC